MTEEEARARVIEDVPRETAERLDALVSLIEAESKVQNLIAASTLPVIWNRHILDSAQLVWLARNQAGLWLDIGSGGGFPGLVVALLREQPTVLVEPRVKRAAFLKEMTERLGIADHSTVISSRVETAALSRQAGIVSARAVAPLPALLAMASLHAEPSTLWLLPKGRTAAAEVAEARREWQGSFELVPSLSDSESAIVVARDVRRKRG